MKSPANPGVAELFDDLGLTIGIHQIEIIDHNGVPLVAEPFNGLPESMP